MSMGRKKKLMLMIPIGIVAIALFIFIGGMAVMYLWNWLLPMLFGWRLITFWQAVGLLALCRILFGGVSGRGHHRSNWSGRRWAWGWKNMTPEEREKFREAVREGCRDFNAPATEPKS